MLGVSLAAARRPTNVVPRFGEFRQITSEINRLKKVGV